MKNFTKIITFQSKNFGQSVAVDQIKTGDFNGDGNQDFVVTRIDWNGLGDIAIPLQVYLGDGSGNFTDQSAIIFQNGIPLVNYVARMIVADFNNDGKSDIFCIDNGIDKEPFTGGQNELFLSTSDGALQNATKKLPQGNKNNHGASVGDINNDGKLDILVNALMQDGNDLQIQDASGKFISSPAQMPDLQIPMPWGGTVPQTNTWSGLIDVNGDGYIDMLLGAWSTVSSSLYSQIYLNNQGNGFTGVAPINLPQSGIPNEIILDFKPIDINGDNLPDLVLSVTNGGNNSEFYHAAYVQILINDGNGKFHDETSERFHQSKELTEDGQWYKSIEVVDLNHDGFDDMVLDNANTIGQVMLNDGNGHFYAADSFQMGQKVAVTDINNDGMSDLILTTANGFEIQINTMSNGHIYKANFGGSSLVGSQQQDTFISSNGNDIFTGNGGIDVVKMHGTASQYTLSIEGNRATFRDSKGNDGSDTLIDISRIQFTDKTIAIDIEGNAGQAYRLYQAAFDRTPDASGLKYWVQKLDEGNALKTAASAFSESAEFIALYGSSNPRNDVLIQKMYNNVLHRDYDEGGYRYWSNLLDAGQMDKYSLLINFSESAENKAALIGVIGSGIEL